MSKSVTSNNVSGKSVTGDSATGGRATKKEVFQYSLGGVGSNIAFIFVMSFLSIFFVTVMKMNPIAVGTLFLVSRLVDAFTDPLMGLIADKTKTKIGKYRPYMIFGAPILAIMTIALFTPLSFTSTGIEAINPTTQLIFVYIAYISYSIASTVVNIPYHALTPVLSSDTKQRSTIVTGKTLGAFIGAIIPGVFTIPMIKLFSTQANPYQELITALKEFANVDMKFGDLFPAIEGIVPAGLMGTKYTNEFLLLDPKAWFLTACVMAVIMTIAFWISQNGAKQKDTYKRTVAVELKGNVTFRERLKVIFKNKPLLMLMIAFTTDMIAFAAANGLNVYYWREVVGNSSYTSILALLGITAGVPFVMLMPKLVRKFGKRAILISGSIATSIIYLIIFFMPTTNPILLLMMFILATGTALIPSTVGWAMLPDCIEYGEWKHGIRGEATVTSGLTFVNKLGMALGGLITGLALAAIGYNADLATQSETTIKGIIVVRTIFPIIGYTCSVIAMKYYELSNSKNMEILADINQRRKSA
jgi:Na+/melibiose symporter-like transporter